MLDITILQVSHATSQEAKKLRPYIEQSHMFSPENAILSAEQAPRVEASWSKVIAKGNRSNAKTWASNAVADDEESHQYYATLFDLLYLNRREIYHVERHSVTEINAIETLVKSGDRAHGEAFLGLEQKRDYDFFLKKLWENRFFDDIMINKRDEHIGQNLLVIEEKMRQQYPSLQQDPLEYAIMLGANHRPDRYANLNLRYVDLTPVSSLIDRFGSLLPSRNSFDDSRSLMLQYALRCVATRWKDYIPEQEIVVMSEVETIQQINRILDKHVKNRGTRVAVL